jgi:hypothetical protein
MRKSILMLVLAASCMVPATGYTYGNTCNKFDRPSDLFSPCKFGEKPVYSCVCDASGCYWNVVCYPTR